MTRPNIFKISFLCLTNDLWQSTNDLSHPHQFIRTKHLLSKVWLSFSPSSKPLNFGLPSPWSISTEDEMVGWYHWFSGHESEQALGDGEGQGSLACCSPWGRKELDTTERMNTTTTTLSQWAGSPAREQAALFLSSLYLIMLLYHPISP